MGAEWKDRGKREDKTKRERRVEKRYRERKKRAKGERGGLICQRDWSCGSFFFFFA